MLKLFDRVREVTTTTGTGTVSLGGADTGYRAFGDVLATGERTCYVIALGTEWEVGIGTYTTSGNTLSRDLVKASSNAGALVSFSAGSKKVWIDHPAFLDRFRQPAKVLIAERFF